MDNVRADLNFDRFIIAENEIMLKSPLTGTVVQVSKSRDLKNSACLTVKQYPLKGFFTSAASDAIDNAPEWVSFTGYTGHIAPYARLANLVKVLHNLPALSGITDRMWS